jgi:hypothetical protein
MVFSMIYVFCVYFCEASLGEHRLRELNDEINKLMRQKHHWEVRIKELGGDAQKGRQFYDIQGKELPGAPGYKYYGAAQELPGVRELFAEKDDEYNKQRNKRTRGDIYKNITPDYYGYRDDDDGVLKKKEAKKEVCFVVLFSWVVFVSSIIFVLLPLTPRCALRESWWLKQKKSSQQEKQIY